jgi:hypothetical protein
MDKIKTILLSVILLCVMLISGCSGSETTAIKHKSEVEIAPGKWLVLERKSEIYASDLTAKNPHVLSPLDAVKQFADFASVSGSSPKSLEFKFAFEWNGKRVEWRGKEIPVTLRVMDDIIYMVGFNRQDSAKCRLVFFRLNKNGTGFDIIKSVDFPHQIATQNMSLYLEGPRQIMVGDEMIDTWEVLRNIDVKNRYFKLSLTAAMWYQIEHGTEYEQIRYNSLITHDFLTNYVAKYKPIALPTIIKEPPEQAATNTVSR